MGIEKLKLIIILTLKYNRTMSRVPSYLPTMILCLGFTYTRKQKLINFVFATKSLIKIFKKFRGIVMDLIMKINQIFKK